MQLNQYLTILVAVGILAGNAAMSLAHDEHPALLIYDFEHFSEPVEENTESEDDNVLADEVDENSVDSIIRNINLSVSDKDSDKITTETENKKTSADDHDAFVKRLQRELNFSKADYRQLLTNLTGTRHRLELSREDKMTLEEQLANIDDQIDLITAKLVDAIRQVVEKENQISLLFEEIEIREIALEYQKSLVRDYIRILYKEENNLFFFDEDGSINAVKLLLADGSVGDNLRDLDYLNLLHETGIQLIDKLAEMHHDLEDKRVELAAKRFELEKLKNSLELEKEQLEMQKASKQDLLRITKGQEAIYSQLLEQTEKEQEEMIADIRGLSDAVSFIKKKIDEEGEDFDPEKYSLLLEERNKALLDFHFDYALPGDVDFVWPVEPNRGISAYFRDSSYYGVFGMQHNAVDIPIYQGSPVRASADAVVYTTRDNGYGYSYIILAHANGFMTVYGHMSAILVSEGQMIKQGAIIGLSGGMPGTLGAGYMTTGPHLHLEFLLNGTYVDPLKYLPLENLSEEHIERLPERYFEAWEEATFRALVEPIPR